MPNFNIFLKENRTVNFFQTFTIDAPFQYLTLRFFSSRQNFFGYLVYSLNRVTSTDFTWYQHLKLLFWNLHKPAAQNDQIRSWRCWLETVFLQSKRQKYLKYVCKCLRHIHSKFQAIWLNRTRSIVQTLSFLALS